jgi:DNA-directed RNA polymerase specialized sigma24 family protein
MWAEDYGGEERFPVAQWSLIGRVGREEGQARQQSLEQFLNRYLPALRAHLVRVRGLSAQNADDVLQDFVARKILQRDLVARADRELGKFRTFLVTALDRFVINWIRDAGAEKRNPAEGAALLGDRAEELPADAGPSQEFDLAWARSVIAEALDRMQAECAAAGRNEVWGVFESRVVRPIREGTEPSDYRELVRRFGFQSPSQASNVLMTAKRMYARLLRSVVGQYARSDREIETEIAELRAILAGSRM